ncbi:hypothetical protein B4U79_17499 [Dinothrombium tinctorium]|uniref:glucan endo-1,3-beta-D-glucosidase n=1 Tax=Dinothrombium tinctorium TaxID=1965070 RepID=A0A3S3REV5_9ACAR|nr:hypothetical protein B4U79_16967 [Dinothrombium tinctorium]RWR99808.1 hypothetical protein B4U79_16966 [Dinothrombium tinctorium]RWS11883.1 hypothetical protein B4U79_17499 [Dinothrombium tinctorium]
MGTTIMNRNNDWDQVYPTCLIAKAAAELNAKSGQKILTIEQGAYQQPNAELQMIEIDRAFKAAEYANRMFSGTVESIIITTLRNIVEISDFIMCNIYPRADLARSSVNLAVRGVTDLYWDLRNAFKNINPRIKVVIGESGWASQGNTSNGMPTSRSNLINYWRSLGCYASDNQIPLYFYEAFDEPLKNFNNCAEAYFGWWFRKGDNFIEKANNC